jgi:hypothetical protein
VSQEAPPFTGGRITTHADPIYTLRYAFGAAPICSVFGFDGLRTTVPQLEPGLYMIRDGQADAGLAERHANGHWIIDMYNGTKAGPGYTIV